MIEVAVKVAFALSLIAANGTHAHPPGDKLPVRHAAQAAPSPTPAPAPTTYSGGVLSENQVASFIRRAGFEEPLVSTLVAIAFRESRFNPRAINSSSGACGLFQLYPCPGPQALNPMANAWLAREKCLASRAAGFSCLRPWGY